MLLSQKLLAVVAASKTTQLAAQRSRLEDVGVNPFVNAPISKLNVESKAKSPPAMVPALSKRLSKTELLHATLRA